MNFIDEDAISEIGSLTPLLFRGANWLTMYITLYPQHKMFSAEYQFVKNFVCNQYCNSTQPTPEYKLPITYTCVKAVMLAVEMRCYEMKESFLKFSGSYFYSS